MHSGKVQLWESLVSRWISVTERMPECQKMILLHAPTSQRGAVDYGFLDFADRKFKVQSMLGWDPADAYGEVTHWMPLPAPPCSELETEVLRCVTAGCNRPCAEGSPFLCAEHGQG